ncbi:TolC family protein [Persephonella sp. KM09-Lau-8]|uniref:TolC family protein n=1 Tax=Persephonella sp. KM09-Lau-8 TaxID=1158345 RepID=UPI000494E47F|nr:TolC family protein [Persephonella sp. KM09-Lau-8]
MFSRFYIVFLLIIGFSYAATYEDILQQAFENSPYLKSYEYKKKAYEGKILSAKQTYNPEIDIEFGRLVSQTESGFALTSFSISQQLRLWGEKDFAIKSAVLQKKAEEYFFQQQRNILAGQIYQIFYEILFLDQQIKIRQKELENLQKLYSFIKEKYELGDALLIDVLRTEKDISLIQLEIQKLKSEKQAKESYLFAIAGINPVKIEGNLYQLNPLGSISVQDIPLLNYYKLLIKSYDEEIKRQKALAKPQISVGLVAEEDAEELGKYEFGIGISSSIPVFYRNQGEIISAVNRKKQLIAKEKQYKLQYQAQIESITNQYKVLTDQINKLDKTAIDKISQSLQLALSGYKEGTITYLELSSLRKQYYQTLLYKAQLYYQLHKLYGEFIKIGGVK